MLSHSFTKAQVSALVATGVDFLSLILLVELLTTWYVLATALAALNGAVVNFMLGRHWSFLATTEHWHEQAKRYFIVALGSLLLNTAGVYVFTEYFEFQYILSKAVTAILVGTAYNYPLHRYYVFAIRG